MVCDVLDLRCIFVNELIGSVTLALIFSMILYFIVASKLRLGFDLTIAFGIPLAILAGLAIGGVQGILAFATVIVALMLAWLFNKIIGNR